MTRLFRRIFLGWIALACAGNVVHADDWEPQAIAESQAADWLKKRDGKITLAFKAPPKTPGFVGKRLDFSDDSVYWLNNKEWSVQLGFQGKVQAGDSVESLKKRFKYMALDKIPAPGLEVKGWNIHPRTGIAAFRDGVEIREYKRGIIKFSVTTKCDCLSGAVLKDLLGPLPDDVSLPKGTYFQLRQEIPLEITFEGPLGFRP